MPAIGCGPVAAIGTALFGLGALYWVLRVGEVSGFATDFLPGQILTGIGVGFTLTNLSAAASSSLPPASLATGTATFGASRQIGATLGVSILLAAVAGAGGELSGAQRGWTLTVVLAAVASLLSLAIGKAHHADLRVPPAPVSVPAPVPEPGRRPPVPAPVQTGRSRSRDPGPQHGTPRRLPSPPAWRSFTHTQGGLVIGHLLAAAADLTGPRRGP